MKPSMASTPAQTTTCQSRSAWRKCSPGFAGLIRRASGQPHPLLRCGGVTLDPRLARVTRDGVPVKLTSHEFRVLSYLMHHRDRVVSQGELTEHIYAQDFDRDSNTVEVFVARLRRKLGTSIIETVRGLGYRLGT